MKNYYEKRKKKQYIYIILFIVIIYWYINGPIYTCPNVDKTSEWYVNDIYMSNQYYYDNLLNDEERELYKNLFQKLKNIEDDIYLGESTETVLKVWNSIICDHPEMINITSLSYSNYGNSIKLNPGYLTKSKFLLKQKERKVQRKIKKIVKEVEGKSEYEKEKKIYEWLGERSSYGHTFLNSDQSAYTAFSTLSNTVCSGYGKAAQILLSNVGVDSIININSNHLWNTVKLDGEYYFFDATVTSSTGESYEGNISYMGLNQNKYTSNYEILYPSILPDVSGEKYNYYDNNGLTITYSEDSISNIKSIIDKSEFKKVELKFTNPEEAYNGIIGNYMEYLGVKNLQTYYDSEGYSRNNGVIIFVKKN